MALYNKSTTQILKKQYYVTPSIGAYIKIAHGKTDCYGESRALNEKRYEKVRIEKQKLIQLLN